MYNNDFLFQDNIALAALLETKDSVWDTSCPQPSEARQQLLVCTAHIHWDPEFCDVKLIQSMMLVDQVWPLNIFSLIFHYLSVLLVTK